jgi:anaerobic selenocysteine-containing dehydrogenase
MKAPFSFIPGSPGPVDIDMANKPTTDELLDLLTAGSRVPLDELRRRPGNSVYPDATAIVAEKDTGWAGRLDVGNVELMADLAALGEQPPEASERFPFRLLSRRLMHVLNSSHNIATTNRGRSHNIAFCNAEDLARLGIGDGDRVEITSERSVIVAVAGIDNGLRPGDISIAHAFGVSPTNRLLSVSARYDRYSGQPLMSNVPVQLRRCDYSSIQS